MRNYNRSEYARELEHLENTSSVRGSVKSFLSKKSMGRAKSTGRYFDIEKVAFETKSCG